MAKQNRNVETLSQVFRVLGDSTRLRIWMTLQDKELNVTALCKRLKMLQPTVSHHLSILRMSGLVNNRRAGKEVFYSLADLERDKSGRALRGLLNGDKAIRVGPLAFGLA